MKTLIVTFLVGAALAAAATAAAPVTLTLASSSQNVKYGSSVTLTGALSTQKTNQQISIQATERGIARPRIADHPALPAARQAADDGLRLLRRRLRGR